MPPEHYVDIRVLVFPWYEWTYNDNTIKEDA